ncbi:unnamed protein product [Acanthoscelides obtectus]|uniref:6-phosphogluconolactonase n=1 Tax=Acanthoscelides obtectus TaxID=200917 RepID=A0A9P0K488_ACAOB|nr:unnamed protein product [Acanthoscelides obtectus]CAK1640365.1 6-phosphogluconolactonase [Acanthoscelides obtectus]
MFCLSGGSLVSFLATGLPNIKTDFSKWRIFFCDERVVPEDDPDSTYGSYKKNLLDSGKVSLNLEQFITIKQGVAADEAAVDYAQKILRCFPGVADVPVFDMLLLGMGPDGHTCSLFPGHPLLDEKTKWIAPITDSPKPPPSRVTMTFPVLNHAKMCVFATAGKEKADMVRRILVEKEDLPAAQVKPVNGKVVWILDKDAGMHIKA